jgi:hypothetical protein
VLPWFGEARFEVPRRGGDGYEFGLARPSHRSRLIDAHLYSGAHCSTPKQKGIFFNPERKLSGYAINIVAINIFAFYMI